jgi:hypothetical protein
MRLLVDSTVSLTLTVSLYQSTVVSIATAISTCFAYSLIPYCTIHEVDMTFIYLLPHLPEHPTPYRIQQHYATEG